MALLQVSYLVHLLEKFKLNDQKVVIREEKK